VVEADNVRAALALVASGAAPLGIVYATDAIAEPRVTVISEVPTEAHDAIVYPAAALAQGDAEDSAALLALMRSEAAGEVFRRHGFGLIADD
jgi:molybdate transport system substrate-binding protein